MATCSYTPSNLQANNEATIEGIVKSITPIKTSRNGSQYYNFTLVDGSKAVRAVNFDTTTHGEMREKCFKKEPIKLSSVTIKRQRCSDGHEIVMNKRSKINSSCATFQDDIPGPEEAMFKKIRDLDVDKVINIKIKVIKLADIEEVTKDGQILKKWSVSVVDSSGILDNRVLTEHMPV